MYLASSAFGVYIRSDIEESLNTIKPVIADLGRVCDEKNTVSVF